MHHPTSLRHHFSIRQQRVLDQAWQGLLALDSSWLAVDIFPLFLSECQVQVLVHVLEYSVANQVIALEDLALVESILAFLDQYLNYLLDVLLLEIFILVAEGSVRSGVNSAWSLAVYSCMSNCSCTLELIHHHAC